VLQRPPQLFDEHIVHPAAAAVHGDRDAGGGERPGEGGRGELRALIGIENPRLAEFGERLFERRQTERNIQRVRQPPSNFAFDSSRNRRDLLILMVPGAESHCLVSCLKQRDYSERKKIVHATSPNSLMATV
jgi:hypothetical protein